MIEINIIHEIQIKEIGMEENRWSSRCDLGNP